jgi:hypothetical protein
MHTLGGSPPPCGVNEVSVNQKHSFRSKVLLTHKRIRYEFNERFLFNLPACVGIERWRLVEAVWRIPFQDKHQNAC